MNKKGVTNDDSEISDSQSDANEEIGKFVRLRKDSTENNDESTSKTKVKKKKRGIIYISSIPKHMNVTMMREIFGQYGKVGRIYLQPEKEIRKLFPFI